MCVLFLSSCRKQRLQKRSPALVFSKNLSEKSSLSSKHVGTIATNSKEDFSLHSGQYQKIQKPIDARQNPEAGKENQDRIVSPSSIQTP
tara:strand:+ start:1724 stop:1990 length:267 start_codon:yes stop_codon:yes gene_type:complete